MQLPYPSAHDFALLLAPMAGVSEAPFRQICREMGADVVLSEFLSSEAIRRRIRTTLEGAEFEPCERPILRGCLKARFRLRQKPRNGRNVKSLTRT